MTLLQNPTSGQSPSTPKARSCFSPSTAIQRRRVLPRRALSVIPSVPGRTWHQESYYFAQQLAQGMGAAGARLRGHSGIRYIYYQGEAKQLVESTYTEVRGERSFTLLEDVNCPAVLAEQCFVTSEEDVARFGSEDGCKAVARIYYEAICAYFGTQPLDTPQS